MTTAADMARALENALAADAHGGRLDEARRRFPDAPTPWIDLSTGVNPRSYPLPEIPLEAWTRLPDADALARLEAAARRAYGAPDHVRIVAGVGTQSFIQWLPQVISARRVAVLGFTYAEHAANWSAAFAHIDHVHRVSELANADVAVVVNPNNPDGRIAPLGALIEIAHKMAARGGLLVIDEAFMDMSPEHSIVPDMPAKGALVLRSFGKAYGLPGVRLGFALCRAALAERLRAAMGPWSVSGPALAIGAAALADAAWLRDSAAELQQSAARLDTLLLDAGFAILGGTQLFRLASHDRASAWFEHLGARGILTRAFVERPAWLRFGTPGSCDSWDRLTLALEDGHGV